MSWSISASGSPAEVAAAVQSQAAANVCAEPEETVKGKIVAAVVAACDGFAQGYGVRVSAHGSQYTADGAAIYNSASLKIEQIEPTAG